jgi:transcriptional regulator with XRE-family HTH domain
MRKKFDGEKVKNLRKKKGLLQKDLAYLLGNYNDTKVSRTCITAWESHKQPWANNLYGLAKLFNKPMEYFFSENMK